MRAAQHAAHQPMSELLRKYKIVAGAHNCGDFIAVLEQLLDDVNDIRVKMPAPDTIESRKAAAYILRDALDSIRKYRNNAPKIQGGSLDY